MKETIELSVVLPATATDIYNAWLSSDGHTNMTGGEAECSDTVGAPFTAWDGYISGTNLSLTPPSQIVQSWRTTEFPEAADDSQLIVQLTEVAHGCEVKLIHTNIPEGQTQYRQGWIDHYFTPMKAFFG